MFLPEDARSFEDILQSVYDGLAPDMKTSITMVAEAMNSGPLDVMVKCIELVLTDLDDPINGPAIREDLHRLAERLQFPLGRDPRRESAA